MAVLDIRGVRIGEGRTKAIVSVMAPDAEELVARAAKVVRAGADLVEWRADHLERHLTTEGVLVAARALREALPETPVIFTFRNGSQGGRRTLPSQEYQALNEAIIESACVDLVDLELGFGDEMVRELAAKAHAHGVATIVSYHDFAGTPEANDLARLLCQEAELGADIPKLATMAAGMGDCLRVMEATARASSLVDRPLLTMAMGEAGKPSRLCGEAFGSALTFCAVGDASAPGQVSLKRALPALEALHEALA